MIKSVFFYAGVTSISLILFLDDMVHQYIFYHYCTDGCVIGTLSMIPVIVWATTCSYGIFWIFWYRKATNWFVIPYLLFWMSKWINLPGYPRNSLLIKVWSEHSGDGKFIIMSIFMIEFKLIIIIQINLPESIWHLVNNGIIMSCSLVVHAPSSSYKFQLTIINKILWKRMKY